MRDLMRNLSCFGSMLLVGMGVMHLGMVYAMKPGWNAPSGALLLFGGFVSLLVFGVLGQTTEESGLQGSIAWMKQRLKSLDSKENDEYQRLNTLLNSPGAFGSLSRVAALDALFEIYIDRGDQEAMRRILPFVVAVATQSMPGQFASSADRYRRAGMEVEATLLQKASGY